MHYIQVGSQNVQLQPQINNDLITTDQIITKHQKSTVLQFTITVPYIKLQIYQQFSQKKTGSNSIWNIKEENYFRNSCNI